MTSLNNNVNGAGNNTTTTSTNGADASSSSSIRLSNGTGANFSSSSDKLKKLQINKNLSSNDQSNSNSNGAGLDYEEIIATIRKSEKGFGFELRNGILIVKVLPNTPAFHSGIRVGDIIIKVNGTCVRSKEPNEITNMIHESNSFVSLTLQRRLSPLNSTKSEGNDENTLKNVTNQINSINNESLKSNDLISNNQQQSQNDYDWENNKNGGVIAADSFNDYIYTSRISNNNDDSLTLTPKSNRKSLLINNNSSDVFNESNDNSTLYPNSHQQQLTNNENYPTSNFNKIDENYQSEDVYSSSSSSSAMPNETTTEYRQKQTQHQQQNDSNRNSISSNNRRAIKKTRSSTNANAKTFQTQSLSNISLSTLTHSASDNDLDNQRTSFNQHQTKYIQDPDDLNLIDYKDELSYTSEDSQEISNDKASIVDISGFSDYNHLINKPIHLSILLNFILSTQNENPKYLYFCIFVDDLIYSNEKKETLFKWGYELYSTFLMPNAPLKIKANESNCKKIEDILERNALESSNQLKKLFDELKPEAIEVVNFQLNKFREVKQIGLANLFNGTDLIKLSQTYKNDSDSASKTLAESFVLYVNEIGREVNKGINDWNDIPTHQEANISALVCSFATFVKKFNIPIKHIGKSDLDKIPIFMSKKSKLKIKNSGNLSSRGHTFIDNIFQSTKVTCSKCNQPFWGIGSQGLLCQKSKCEVKLHRSCFSSGCLIECHGSQKTIRTDYKEKFQNILFGTKKKDEEPSVPMETNISTHNLPSKNQFLQTQNSSSSILNNVNNTSGTISSNDYDRQVLNGEQNQLNNFPRNLPVELAIKKFEMLNAKKSTPPLVTSPTGNGCMLNRTNTISSGSGSPTNSNNSSNIFRHNSVSNALGIHNPLLSNENNNQNISDPEPDEIKNAISSTTTISSMNSSNNLSEKYPLGPDTIVDDSFNNNSSSSSSQLQNPTSLNNRASASPSTSNFNTLSHQNSSIFTSSTSATRHSWMNNDSDMEVDEELPNLSINIDRHHLEKLTKKEMKIQEVINELIHTEQKHVRNLKIMKHHFYIPIRIEMCLTDDERNLLFPNLEEILDLHSTFNNKLKELRRENPIVPLKQLIEIILEQFEGEIGNHFKQACATFCQNQGEAMKLLQNKLKHDKFSAFLNKAENDQVCRKLHLKDFIPTEVQRLVKYRLLFQELTKNADEKDKENLLKCVDASSLISQYVNKAVTECENKKRCQEIQSKMDTKEFDQYCIRSPLLLQYKNLDLRTRKLIYEGELEWKMNGSIKLMAFLFQDILLFLECEKSNEEKRRYVLRPLLYTINKKMMFTPVIPLQCINSFSPMHEKRNFHLVVIIDDNNKRKSIANSTKSIETQMLFIFTAKSGDERNKWTGYLQELTGKMSQTDKTLNTSIDLTQTNNQNHQSIPSNKQIATNTINPLLNRSNTLNSSSFTASLIGNVDSNPIETNNTTNKRDQSNTINSVIKSSVSSSSLPLTSNRINNEFKIDKTLYENSIATNTNDFVNTTSLIEKTTNMEHDQSIFDQNMLKSQLNENSQEIIELLRKRHSLLIRLLKIENSSQVEETAFNSNRDLSCYENKFSESATHSQDLLNYSISLLNIMTKMLISDDYNSSQPKDQAKLIENIIKLENNLNKLQKNTSVEAIDSREIRLPNLTLASNSDLNFNINNMTKINRRQSAGNHKKNLKTKKINKQNTIAGTKHSKKVIQRFNDSSDLQQTSILSSLSTNADLSEDEQINYYNDYEDEEEKKGTDLLTNDTNKNQITIDSTNRRSSNSSERTLVVMPADSIITQSINLNLRKNENQFYQQDESDNDQECQNEEEEEYNDVQDDNFEHEDEDSEEDEDVYLDDDYDNNNLSEDEVEEEEDDDDDEADAAQEDEEFGDEVTNQEFNSNLISIKIKPKSFTIDDQDDQDDSLANYDPPPNLPKSDPPTSSHPVINSNNLNDLSDDEIKEYHVFKENFEDSSV